MFLYSIKTECMICDFQLVYESDGRFMLDLYAYGQMKEPASLEVEAAVNCIDCGLISISCNDFKRLESKLDSISEDNDILEKHTRKMHQRITNLIEKCNEMEACLAQNKVSLEVMYEGFNALTDVIAYRRLADKASDLLISEIGTERLASMRLPSYLVMLQAEMDKLGNKSTKAELELFIQEYGYLTGFSVLENKYENINYVKAYAADNEGTGYRIEPLFVPYELSDDWTKNEKIFYELSWYSECKHIYQLRVLRNLRRYMKRFGFDLIKTDARELFKDVPAFKTNN